MALTGNGNESVTSSVEPTSRPSSCPVTRFGAHSWQCFTSFRMTWPSSCTARSRLSFACEMHTCQSETAAWTWHASSTICVAPTWVGPQLIHARHATGDIMYPHCDTLQGNQQSACKHTIHTFAGADVAAAKFMGSLTPMAAAEWYCSSLHYAGPLAQPPPRI